MAIDTRSKRACVPGVGRPWMRGKLPDAAKDQAWRVASGNAYNGNPIARTRLSFGKRVIAPIRGLRVEVFE